MLKNSKNQQDMAIQNYTQRLANLQSRKFDRELNESLISKSFSSTDIPDNVKYMVESMRPIDNKYNEKTIEAAKRAITLADKEKMKSTIETLNKRIADWEILLKK